MPTVPVYQQQVQSTRTPDVRSNVQAPVEAFGGGQANTGFQGGQELVSSIAKVAQSAYDDAQEVEFQSNALKATKLRNELQTKVSELRGRDAGAASELIDKEWKKGIEGLGLNLTGRFSKEFEKDLGSQYESLRHQTELHIASQTREVDAQETKALVDTEIDTARGNAFDDAEIGASVARIQASLAAHARRNGVYFDKDGNESPIYKEAVTSALSKAHETVIQARLDAGQFYSAQNYFNEKKKAGEINSQFTERISNALENQAVVVEGDRIWKGIIDKPEMRMSGGDLNQQAVLDSVEAAKGMTPKRAEAVRSYLKARLGEQMVMEHQDRQNTDRLFVNEALKAKSEGRGLDYVMSLAPSFSRDPKDLAEKQAEIRKLFSGPENTDPVYFQDLEDKVKFGQAGKDEIMEAWNAGKIGTQQMQSLRDSWRTVLIKGVNEEEKLALDMVQADIKDSFGNDSKKISAFRALLRTRIQGKQPWEIPIIANEMMGKVKGSGVKIPFTNLEIGQKAEWKVDTDKRRAQNELMSSLSSTIGQEEFRAIQKGLNASEGTVDGDAINRFASSFGGVEKLKKGMPANNAIQSILRYNAKNPKKAQPITPATIQKVLNIYPDGVAQ